MSVLGLEPSEMPGAPTHPLTERRGCSKSRALSCIRVTAPLFTNTSYATGDELLH